MTEALQTEPLGATEAERLDAYWRAANYLSVGQIYLLEALERLERARDLSEAEQAHREFAHRLGRDV